MKINGSGMGGATYLLHLCKQCLEIHPSPRCAREGRVKILSGNLMPAHLFPSPAKLKKKKRERKDAWAGAAGREVFTCEAPASPAESAAGVGPTAPKRTTTLEISEMALGFLRERSLSFGIG